MSTEANTRREFASNQEVRWCPGCGDYAILATLQRLLPSFGVPREKVVFVSGIGCSGRFPYYMNTYGFHTLHGRAPAVATGLKLTRPELSVWLVTGDGDGLSIGANHLLHLLRRNLNINVLLFNNRVYGLTKGQYSPTSEVGKRSKTTPLGSLEQPVNPLSFALSAEASFVARALDVDAKGLSDVLTAAFHHKGTSFIEILQNCNVFNDGAFENFAAKDVRGERTFYLRQGEAIQSLGFAAVMQEQGLAILSLAQAQTAAIQHDTKNLNMALQLARLAYPESPVPLGVFYQNERPTYEDLLQKQREIPNKGFDLYNELFQTSETWSV